MIEVGSETTTTTTMTTTTKRTVGAAAVSSGRKKDRQSALREITMFNENCGPPWHTRQRVGAAVHHVRRRRVGVRAPPRVPSSLVPNRDAAKRYSDCALSGFADFFPPRQKGDLSLPLSRFLSLSLFPSACNRWSEAAARHDEQRQKRAMDMSRARLADFAKEISLRQASLSKWDRIERSLSGRDSVRRNAKVREDRVISKI